MCTTSLSWTEVYVEERKMSIGKREKLTEFVYGILYSLFFWTVDLKTAHQNHTHKGACKKRRNCRCNGRKHGDSSFLIRKSVYPFLDADKHARLKS